MRLGCNNRLQSRSSRPLLLSLERSCVRNQRTPRIPVLAFRECIRLDDAVQMWKILKNLILPLGLRGCKQDLGACLPALKKSFIPRSSLCAVNDALMIFVYQRARKSQKEKGQKCSPEEGLEPSTLRFIFKSLYVPLITSQQRE